jgi:hypothetical protein
MLSRYTKDQVEALVDSQPEGPNTKFLKSAHNLWFRFKNYDKHPPFVLEDNGPVALVFITLSDRSKYANLYEIVTLEGMEGNGYASKVYWEVMSEAYKQGMKRLKMSCTPSSVTWHKRNGTLFWGVDPSGSLRCNVPLFPNLHEQLTFRELALKDADCALPDPKVINQLKADALEAHGFGPKKTAKVEQAISDVGDYWLRDALYNENTLESFF